MSYTDFFRRATRTEEQPDGLTPFPYQCRLAESPVKGKKKAATLAPSAWKRSFAQPTVWFQGT